jgi:hypothetical protein
MSPPIKAINTAPIQTVMGSAERFRNTLSVTASGRFARQLPQCGTRRIEYRGTRLSVPQASHLTLPTSDIRAVSPIRSRSRERADSLYSEGGRATYDEPFLLTVNRSVAITEPHDHAVLSRRTQGAGRIRYEAATCCFLKQSCRWRRATRWLSA